MLTPNTLLLSGLRANPPLPTVDNFEEWVKGALGPVGSLALAGFVTAIHETFPDAEAWQSEAGKKLVEIVNAVREADPAVSSTVDWNAYYLGRWGAVGDVNALRELIRRAKHRDGTTEAAEMSTAALVAFSEVQDDPKMAAVLAQNGFTPGSLKFGSHPPGSQTAFAVAPASTKTRRVTPAPVAIATRRAAAVPPGAGPVTSPFASDGVGQPETQPAPAAAPVAEAASPRRYSRALNQGKVSADLASGQVRIGGNLVGIGAALSLASGITGAVRSLLLPEDGYAWIDDAADPQSKTTLVLLDVMRGKGLPENQDFGGLTRAVVTQDPGTPGNPTVSYSHALYTRNGTTQNSGGFPDIHAAQADVARRVSALPNGDLLTEAELAAGGR